MQACSPHQPVHCRFQIVRGSVCRGDPVRLHLCKSSIPAFPCRQFLGAVLLCCPYCRIHIIDRQPHAQPCTKLLTECSVPFAFGSAEMVIDMHRCNCNTQHRTQFQQAAEQTHAVRPAGKGTADSLFWFQTVQLPQLLQYCTGNGISPHHAFPHWRSE